MSREPSNLAQELDILGKTEVGEHNYKVNSMSLAHLFDDSRKFLVTPGEAQTLAEGGCYRSTYEASSWAAFVCDSEASGGRVLAGIKRPS